MRYTLILSILCCHLIIVSPAAAEISVALDNSLQDSGGIRLALSKLRSAPVKGDNKNTVKVGIDKSLGKETFSLTPDKQGIAIKAGDRTGAMYGLFELTQQLHLVNGDWAALKSATARPRFEFRAIKFNLPWDAYRSNEAITIHMETCKDLAYWEAFLNMMAENRFNVLSLWNLHPFTYMVKPKNFPEASPFSDAELAQWRALFSGIFKLAKERGIDTYIVNWNIFVSKAYQQAHKLPRRANISVAKGGITQQQMDLAQRYNREIVTQVLNEYPDLTGIGLSLGEAMGGMTAQEREDWMLNAIIKGAQLADRPVKLIHRVPFSAGLRNGGTTSVATEQLTRNALEQITDIEYPIYIEAKFNWSHGHSTPKLIKVHGGKITDTYWNPMPKNYKMAWMIRNEDFFILRWGQADFIRQHIQMNGQDYVGGYFVGSETYIPAKDYFTIFTDQRDWRWAFERQWLFYKLWGRLLYNPQTPDTVFIEEFTRRYGEHGSRLFKALQIASKMPLRLQSYVDLNNDKSFYAEGFLARDKEDSSEFLNIDLLLKKPTLDPDYVSASEYAEKLLAKESFSAEKILPLELAKILEAEADQAITWIKGIKPDSEALRQELVDIEAWTLLGRYFADKLRAAVSLAMYRKTRNRAHQAVALTHMKKGIRDWKALADITESVYDTVPLTHFHRREIKTFHWRRLLEDEVEKDLDIIKRKLPGDNKNEAKIKLLRSRPPHDSVETR